MNPLRDVRVWTLLFVGTLLVLGGWLAELRRDGLRWTRAFEASQTEFTWATSSLLLEHYRLGATLRAYAAGDAEDGRAVDRETLIERLDIYLSRYDVLGTDADRRLARLAWTDTASPASRARIETLDIAFAALHEHALDALADIETELREIMPSDTARIASILHRLDGLGERVGTYFIDTFERERHLNRARRRMADRLSERVRFAGGAIACTGGLLILLLSGHFRHRAVSAAALAKTNERLAAEVEESTRLASELARRATHDDLSALLNRRGLSDELARVLAEPDGVHGLCFIDLDRFKIVNDACGHAVGDRLIVEIGALIGTHARAGDLLSRHGGDEFVLLLRECSWEAFRRRVDALCESLRDYHFVHAERRFDVSGSIGAVHFHAAETTPEELLARADAASYVAKRAGGARVHFHGDRDGPIEARREELERLASIQNALDHDRFRLYRQPIMALSEQCAGGRGWELLLRMVGEDGEVLSPAHFLDVAERYSLATSIDRWVVGEAFDLLAADPDAYADVCCININLSGRSVGDAEFLAFLEERTKTLALPPSRICFELTESAVIGEHAQEFLARVKTLGYGLALDDFGSGFSSFGYLERLPVDCIKIDGSFVRDIDVDPVHREFVRAIGDVGRAMGKRVVAEFVGSERVMEILRELGVDYAQGYHVGKPEPMPTAPARIESAA